MRKDFIDESGKSFGKWFVSHFVPEYKKRSAHWLCKCECGNKSIVRGADLRNGTSTQCKSCQSRETSTKHGKSCSKVYQIWRNMKSRFYDSVCDSWKDDFINFYKDMGDPPPGGKLDRVDNDEPYSKNNCRWAIRKGQRFNQA